MKPRFPKVVIDVGREQGSGFFLIGRAAREMGKAGIPERDVMEFAQVASCAPNGVDGVIETLREFVTVRDTASYGGTI